MTEMTGRAGGDTDPLDHVRVRGTHDPSPDQWPKVALLNKEGIESKFQLTAPGSPMTCSQAFSLPPELPVPSGSPASHPGSSLSPDGVSSGKQKAV